MKQLICNKLLALMETQPYENIKVTELVKYIGIGRSTFYSHFDSIYAVLQMIEDDFIAGLPPTDAHAKESIPNSRKVKIDYFNYLKRNKYIYRILNGPNGDPSFKIRLANRSRRILLANPPAPVGASHTAMEKRAIFEFLHGGNDRLIAWWLEHDDDISISNMVTLIETLTTDIFAHLTPD